MSSQIITAPDLSVSVTLLERIPAGHSWQSTTTNITTLCDKAKTSCEIFAFLSYNEVLKAPQAQAQLSAQFSIPPSFWETLYRRSNGFFKVKETFDGQELSSLITWFKIQVKHVSSLSVPQPKDGSYSWQNLRFFSRATPSSAVILCFDAPHGFQNDITQNASSLQNPSHIRHTYSWHLLLFEQALKLYDDSVWGIRDVVRELEQKRPNKIKKQPDFEALHENARHATHSTETITVAVEVLAAMLQHFESLVQLRFGPNLAPLKGCSPHEEEDISAIRQTEQDFRAQIQMLNALKERSRANEARLQNEITLSFNVVSQRDSNASVRLAESASSDSQAMRQIAFLTLLFLPATFVSAIFSTTFFAFEADEQQWIVSNKFWIFWVVTVPLTLLTYFLWSRVRSKSSRHEEQEWEWAPLEKVSS